MRQGEALKAPPEEKLRFWYIFVEVFDSAVSRPLIGQLSPFLLFNWWKEQIRTPQLKGHFWGV